MQSVARERERDSALLQAAFRWMMRVLRGSGGGSLTERLRRLGTVPFEFFPFLLF